MSTRTALFAIFLFFAFSLDSSAQVTGGPAADAAPDAAPGTPGTTPTIQGTAPTIPGTIPTRPPAPGIPDLSLDNTNISGRFENLDRGSIFDTRNNTLTGNGESIFIDDRASVFGQAPPSGQEGFAVGPQTPSTLDNGIFSDGRDSLNEDTIVP